MQIGLGFSDSPEPLKAAKEAISKAFSSMRENKVSLGLIFSDASLDNTLLIRSCNEALGEVPLLGLNAEAIIAGQRSFGRKLAIVLFGLPEQVYFNTACVKDITRENAFSLGGKLGEDLLYGCKGVRRNLSIIFSDTYTPDTENITYGLQERVGRSFPIIGASVYKEEAHKTSVYFDGSVYNNAACGVLFGGKLNFGLGIKHGWKPLGKPRTIIKSSGNTVYQIDNEKAVQFYREYLAKDTMTLKKEKNRIADLYPLGIEITEKKDYILRSLLSIQDDGSLIFNGDMPENSLVRLMISSKEAALDAAREAARQAKESLGNQEAKIVFVFNSLAIGRVLGQEEQTQEREIRRVFGETTPVIGIYTCAQQAPLSNIGFLGKTYFHNNSIAILALNG